MNPLLSPSSMQLANEILKENNKTLKQIFKGKINSSFLIKIKNTVLDTLGEQLYQFMPLQLGHTHLLTGNVGTHEYDICRMIVGTHLHHSIFLTKDEIQNHQKNPEYQKKLVSEVIEKIQLHSLSNLFLSKNQLLPGDDFLYFPVPYELFALCTRYYQIISEPTCQVLIYDVDIINNALATLTLMEKNLLTNAYPLCRGMIEQYFKILILNKHPECLKPYENFCFFEIEQSCCSQNYPDEFIHLFENRKQISVKSKVDFLHYGWLDVTQSNPYSLYGIIEYLQNTSDDTLHNDINLLTSMYKNCHGYTHGSSHHVKYPLLNYFELSIMLYYVVKNMFLNLHRKHGIEMHDDDKKLLMQLERDFGMLKTQYEMRSTEGFEEYYKMV